MADAQWMTAEEAARALDVRRQTLYAYVSRGLLTSAPGPGPSRARRYNRAAVEQLVATRGRTSAERAAAGATDWGVPILDSELTLIADGRLFYRGRDAIELSRTASLEQVADILWGAGADGFDAVRPSRPAPAAGRPIERMQAFLAQASRARLASVSSPEPARLRAATELVTGLFAAAGATGTGTLAERLARGWRTPHADVLSAALVMCADHELNVSAFTARCVASADARFDQVLLAALAAFSGRRHGGAGARVGHLLDDAERHDAVRAVARALDDQGEVPGFGHPLYPNGDPRATELMRIAPPPAGGDEASAVAAHCAKALGLAPNLDFGLATLARRLNLPAAAGATLFALVRSVGWIAHAIETWDDGALIRPRARYVGPPANA